MKIENTKNNNGITLIALIITIIIMLILAGVVISLTLGENGLFSTAKYAVVKTKEETAREKLELALVDLQAKKYTDIENYNENGYIDGYLSKEGMVVIGDIVIADGWKFSIDRSVPQIGESLGKGEESKKIEIATDVENALDYTSSTIKIEITYEGTLKEIKINGQGQEIPEKDEEGKYVIEKEVTTNGKYTIYVKDQNDEYKTSLANVTEISEDMEIRTAQDLVTFRDRVNKGATYAGRTINLVNDIDLSSVCYKVDGTIANDKSWEPISYFFGTFDGRYYTISHLYINSNLYQDTGLFGYNEGTIKNVILDQLNIYSSCVENKHNGVGGICGGNDRSIINCGVKSGNIKHEGTCTTEIYNAVGGICGRNKGIIDNCYNETEVIAINNNTNSNVRVWSGGISGSSSNSNAIISNCYNKGNIRAEGGNSAIGGIAGVNTNAGTVENSYNYGEVNKSGDGYLGGIIGRTNSGSAPLGKVINSYCIKNTTYSYYGNTTGLVSEEKLKTYAETLGDAFVEDEQNADKTWKYNDGYPVLKWQMKINKNI